MIHSFLFKNKKNRCLQYSLFLCAFIGVGSSTFAVDIPLYGPYGEVLLGLGGCLDLGYQGNTLVTVGMGGIFVWDMAKGLVTGHYPPPENEIPWVVYLFPDAKRILTDCDEHKVRIWDLTTGTNQLVPEMAGQMLGGFSSKGNWFLTFTEDHYNESLGKWLFDLSIWDAKTLGLVNKFSLTLPIFFGQTTLFDDISFSPDEQWLLFLTIEGYRIKNIVTGEERTGFGLEEPVDFAQFSPDGKKLMTVCFDEIPSEEEFPTNEEFPQEGDFPPDSTCFRIWDWNERNEICSFVLEKHAYSAYWFPDGSKILVLPYDVGISLWDARNGEMLYLVDDEDTSAALQEIFLMKISPDGSYFISCTVSGLLTKWDAMTGAVVQTTSIELEYPWPYVLSNQDHLLFWLDPRGIIHCWNTQQWIQVQQYVGHTGIMYVEQYLNAIGPYLIMSNPVYKPSLRTNLIFWDMDQFVTTNNYVLMGDEYSNFSFSNNAQYCLATAWDRLLFWNLNDLKGGMETEIPESTFVAYPKIPLTGSAGETIVGLGSSFEAIFMKDEKNIVTWNNTGVLDWNMETNQIEGWLQSPGDTRGVWFSPDESKLVIDTYENQIELFHFPTYKTYLWDWEKKTFLAERRDVTADYSDVVETVQFSSDSRWLLVFFYYSFTELLDANTGEVILEFPYPFDYDHVFFPKNSDHLFYRKQDYYNRLETIHVYDPVQKKEIFTLQRTYSYSFPLVSQDGRYLISQGEDSIYKVYDVNIGQEIVNLGRVEDVTFSPNDNYVMLNIGPWRDGEIWDTRTWEKIDEISGFVVYDARFSPDGEKLLIEEWYDVVLWDLEKRIVIHRFEGDLSNVSSSFSTDGRIIITDDYLDNGWEYLFWDVTSGEMIGKIPYYQQRYPDAIKSLELSPTGRFALIRFYNGYIELWEIRTQKKVESFDLSTNKAREISFDPQETYICIEYEYNHKEIWQVATETRIRNFDELFGYFSGICELSPDGKSVLAAHPSSGLSLWDIIGGSLIRTFSDDSAPAEEISVIEFSRDGKTILSAGKTGVAVWDRESGDLKQVLAWDEPVPSGTYPIAAAFSHDGSKALVGTSAGTVFLWDIVSEERIQIFSTNETEIQAVTFSPDGSEVLVEGRHPYDYVNSEDGYYWGYVWNIGDNEPFLDLGTYPYAVKSIFSPHGLLVLCGDPWLGYQLYPYSQMNLHITSTPAIAYKGKEVTFNLRYQNVGENQVENVVVECQVPNGLQVQANNITHGGKYDIDTRTIVWDIGQVNTSTETSQLSYKAVVTATNTEDLMVTTNARIYSRTESGITFAVASTLLRNPTVESVTPAKAGNTQILSVEMKGKNLTNDLLIKLVKDGENDIVGIPVGVSTDGTSLTVQLNLINQSPGVWNLAVVSSAGDVIYGPVPFQIEAAGEAKVWVEIVGSASIRIGREETFIVRYGNAGNITAPISNIFISIPHSVEYKTNLPVNPWIDYNTSMTSEGDKILNFEVVNIPPYSTRSFLLTIRPTTQMTGLKIRAAIIGDLQLASLMQAVGESEAGKMIRIDHVLVDSGDNSSRITSIVVRFPASRVALDGGHIGFKSPDGKNINLSGVEGSDTVVIKETSQVWWQIEIPIPNISDQQAQKLYEWAKQQVGKELLYNNGSSQKDIERGKGSCDGFVEKGLETVGYNNGKGMVSNFIESNVGLTIARIYENVRKQNPNLPPFPEHIVEENLMALSLTAYLNDVWALEKFLSVVTSYDPNIKVGPLGYDPDANNPKHFIGDSHPIGYRIGFENLETATAAAQEVLIVDHLDTQFDFTSFSFGTVKLGSQSVEVTADSRSLNLSIDLRPNFNTIVKITGTYDANTGEARWLFQGLDPITHQLSDFLPPNTQENSPQGEGWVSFQVKPISDRSTGTVVKNQAMIDFEVGIPPNPMDTPEVFHTLDTSAPNAAVNPLPEISEALSFRVEWSGQDDAGGSGIRDYTIYVSDMGQPFVPWQVHIPDTSAPFEGVNGHTYAFNCIATDNVGNETHRTYQSQAETTIQVKTATPNHNQILEECDFNGNQEMDGKDLFWLQSMWYKTVPSPNDNIHSGDANRDGQVNYSDLLLLKSIWKAKEN